MWHPGLQHVENVSHDKVTDLTASSPALLDNIIPIHIPLRNEFIWIYCTVIPINLLSYIIVSY
jgi:hypothetical protein